MMKRILFVDDESRILQGLERMFRGKRNEWEMLFVTSGEEALVQLQMSPFDVIVTDMKMPGMDGATLLREVQARFPHTVRIVLSGYAEMEMTLRTVPVAHQFLSKPCEASHLEKVIGRACDLQALLNEDLLKDTVGKIDHFPTMPQVYWALTQALARPKVPIKEIAAIVEQDMGISVKVLQLVNSAFFSLPRRVTDMTEAITCIGLNMLKHLSLSVEVFRSFEGRRPPHGFTMEDLQRHAVRTANLAKKMFKDKQKSEDAFIAGMLHDIGKLIMMIHLPKNYQCFVEAAQDGRQEDFVVEKELFGVTHAEIGAYLLGLWGLPYPVVEAVAHHHQPRRVSHQEFDIVSAVYAANRLTYDDGFLMPGENDANGIDMEYLQMLQVEDRLPLWKEWAAQIAKT
jgi:putative nucleotidyltransferase with HDIG domain